MSVNTAVMETDDKLVLVPTNEVARNEVGTELDDTKKETVTNVKKLKNVMEPNVKAAGGHYRGDRTRGEVEF
ncbi:MAG: hypothetical protein J6B87_02000 [Clostridia bacterium]|nr:hypothetical protein [Clostridia bacterium]